MEATEEIHPYPYAYGRYKTTPSGEGTPGMVAGCPRKPISWRRFLMMVRLRLRHLFAIVTQSQQVGLLLTNVETQG